MRALALFFRADLSAFLAADDGVLPKRSPSPPSLGLIGVENKTLPFGFVGVPPLERMPLAMGLAFFPLPGGLPRRGLFGVSAASLSNDKCLSTF